MPFSRSVFEVSLRFYVFRPAPSLPPTPGGRPPRRRPESSSFPDSVGTERYLSLSFSLPFALFSSRNLRRSPEASRSRTHCS